MKSFARSLALTCGVAISAAAPAIHADAAAPAVQRYVVTFQPGAGPAGKTALHAAKARVVLDLDAQNAVAAEIPAAAVAGLSRNPNIELVEPDVVRYPMAQTIPYGISMVQADKIHSPNTANRTVCVIDSGYSLQHEDLADTGVSGSTDPATGDWRVDSLGHGTHVAGSVAAANNDRGVVGAAPGVKLHIVKVFGEGGFWAYSSTLVSALNECAAAGANVVNMSLSGAAKSNLEERAFRTAYKNGMLLVAAAGNGGTTSTSYPAGYSSVISVGAVDAAQNHAAFSQANKDVELTAPGVGVLSTVPWVGVQTLAAGGRTFTGREIEGAARATASGDLVDGGLCDAPGAWTGKVVLCQRGSGTFADKVAAVTAGGGVAAAIYNNAPGNFDGTLEGMRATIPAISLSDTDGSAARALTGTVSTVVNRVDKPASGYEELDGTSMAAPHVSGVAALVWSCNPSWTNTQIRDALDSTAKDLGAAGRDPSFGFGLVQARAALDALGGGTC